MRAVVGTLVALIVAAAAYAYVAPRVGLGSAVVTAIAAGLLVGYVVWATRPPRR